MRRCDSRLLMARELYRRADRLRFGPVAAFRSTGLPQTFEVVPRLPPRVRTARRLTGKPACWPCSFGLAPSAEPVALSIRQPGDRGAWRGCRGRNVIAC
jgi:hypothetical protein